MKHILITGGFGFIGSHLTERLLKDGHRVHVVDNLSSHPVPIRRLMEEMNRPRELSCYIGTVAEYCRFPKLPKFDYIYHLASPVGPAGVLKHAGNMIQQVVDDTYAIMKLAQAQGVRMVDVSTSEVYGGGQGGLCAETMPRIIQAETTIRLEYAMAKLAMETAIINTCTVKNLDAVIIRPFNVAGPRQSGVGGFVLPRFVDAVIKSEDIPVFGDGQQIRAFTDVRDIVDGLILAMVRGRKGEVYNLGNPANKTTILALAERVLKNIPSSHSKIIYMDGKAIFGPLYREAANKYPDSSKAFQELEWKPSISIDKTIKDVWLYQRNIRPIEQELIPLT